MLCVFRLLTKSHVMPKKTQEDAKIKNLRNALNGRNDERRREKKVMEWKND